MTIIEPLNHLFVNPNHSVRIEHQEIKQQSWCNSHVTAAHDFLPKEQTKVSYTYVHGITRLCIHLYVIEPL